MNEESRSVDELIDELYACMDNDPEETPLPQPAPVKKKKHPGWRRFGKIVGVSALILIETAVLLVGALYGMMYVLAKGPSPTARDIFIRSVKETSAAGFIAELFFSQEEIDAIMGRVDEPEYEDMDDSMIQIPTKPNDGDPTAPTGPVADAWGFVDEDGDGIILDRVKGEGYSGYMMIVLDPSRVIMGSVPSSYGDHGYTVETFVKHFDAVAGVNGGGFHDPNGQGNGSIPSTMVVFDGKIYYAEYGTQWGFAGFDSKHILHVGNFTPQEIRDRDIQYGVSYGPVLVLNGEMVDSSILGSGVNPRTAIGQRSDGAVLLLVVDGRQVSSLGATYMDLAEVFLDYGAVNACNLDGGSSSMMWYQDGYVNTSASLIGIRPIPTSFLVLKEGQK